MPALPLAVLAILPALCLSTPGVGEEAPTDALLKLLPADAAAVLAADDLRGRWAEFVGSPIARDVAALPAFRAWRDSPGVLDFLRARDQILGFLNTTHAEIRDEILGDAAVLAVLPPEPPNGSFSKPRGLLTLKARNPDRLRKLIDRINDVQHRNGEIAAIEESKQGRFAYFTRRYPDGSGSPGESYVLFPDGVFALSDSRAAVLDLIDRKAGVASGPSFAEAPGFAKTAAALSGRPLARVFLSPAALRKAIDEQPESSDPVGRAVVSALRSHLDGLDRIAAALDADASRIQIRTVQAFQPDALRRAGGTPFALFRPADDRSNAPGPRMLALPETAVAAASFRVDASALYREFVNLIPKADRPRAAKLETIADALLLGRGLRASILPALGPRAAVYLDAPDPSGPRPGPFPIPIVASIEINEDRGDAEAPHGPATADALDNALRAVLATLALDEKRTPAAAQIVTRDGVTSLDAPYPFAFAIDAHRRRLTVGTSAVAIARYLQAGARTNAGSRFREIRSRGFPDCESFAAADLPAIVSLAERHRDRLTAAVARREGRPEADAARDVDQILAAVRLFDAAFLASRSDAPAAMMEHRFGLIAGRSASP